MDDHNAHIPIVTEPLSVEVADDEIVLTTQHDAASLTPDAAEETARRLTDAASRLRDGHQGRETDGV